MSFIPKVASADPESKSALLSYKPVDVAICYRRHCADIIDDQEGERKNMRLFSITLRGDNDMFGGHRHE